MFALIGALEIIDSRVIMSWSKFVFFIVLIIFISQKFPSLAQRIHQSVLVALVQERAMVAERTAFGISLFKPIAINVTANNSSSPQPQPEVKAKIPAKQAPLTTFKPENRLSRVAVQERCRPVETELDKMLKEQNVGCWL